MFKRGALAKVLEDQTFDLKAGESTQPIRTRQGYVILKVTEHAQAGPAPMKSVEPQIQEAIYISQMQPALRAYLTKLREQSYVDIQPGFVDSGASAKETKPVFTAYAPPPVKEKKPKDRARFDRAGGKVPVVSSPDNGGRTLTGAEAKESGVDPATGLANAVVPAKPGTGKPAHVKREKVRFGQAPQNALPAAPEDVATTAAPAPTAPVSTTLGGVSSDAPAAVPDAENPLSAPAAPRQKTRFAAAARQVKEQKVEVADAKKAEKARATPTPVSTDEKAAQQTQSAPLGLNGDTSKKPAKPARPEGAPKERLADKPKEAPVTAPTVDQTANPALAPTEDTPVSTRTTAPAQNPNNAPTPVQNTPQTTLPPVTQPIPGSSNQGQPVLPPGAPQ